MNKLIIALFTTLLWTQASAQLPTPPDREEQEPPASEELVNCQKALSEFMKKEDSSQNKLRAATLYLGKRLKDIEYTEPDQKVVKAHARIVEVVKKRDQSRRNLTDCLKQKGDSLDRCSEEVHQLIFASSNVADTERKYADQIIETNKIWLEREVLVEVQAAINSQPMAEYRIPNSAGAPSTGDKKKTQKK